MSNYEVLYFDGAGRAEAVRVMLHAAGIDFQDTRFAHTDWPALKPTTPLGAVPVLKIDGVSHVQCLALARYAAKKAGFYPDDPFQALVVDEVLESINEVTGKAPQDPDADEKKRKRQEWQTTGLTQYADFIESRIQKFGNGNSVIGVPSIADVFLKSLVGGIQSGSFDHVDKDFFDKYPGITATNESISKNPKIVAYYDSVAK